MSVSCVYRSSGGFKLRWRLEEKRRRNGRRRRRKRRRTRRRTKRLSQCIFLNACFFYSSVFVRPCGLGGPFLILEKEDRLIN